MGSAAVQVAAEYYQVFQLRGTVKVSSSCKRNLIRRIRLSKETKSWVEGASQTQSLTHGSLVVSR
jgi:hypothetical protein